MSVIEVLKREHGDVLRATRRRTSALAPKSVAAREQLASAALRRLSPDDYELLMRIVGSAKASRTNSGVILGILADVGLATVIEEIARKALADVRRRR